MELVIIKINCVIAELETTWSSLDLRFASSDVAESIGRESPGQKSSERDFKR